MTRFQYRRQTQFYETDGMGIIHHANYVLYMEEARTGWLKSLQIHEEGDLLGAINFPVLECRVQYKKPIYFDDDLTLEVLASHWRARLQFEYTFSTKRFDIPVAFGKTVHAVMNMKTRRPIRLPQDILDCFRGKESHG